MSTADDCVCIGCVSGEPRKWCIMIIKNTRYYYQYYRDGTVQDGLYREISDGMIDLSENWHECADGTVLSYPIENKYKTLFIPLHERFLYGYCDQHD